MNIPDKLDFMAIHEEYAQRFAEIMIAHDKKLSEAMEQLYQEFADKHPDYWESLVPAPTLTQLPEYPPPT